MKKLSIVLALLLILTFKVTSYGDTAVKSLSLNDVINMAIKSSTDLKSSDAEIGIKEIELEQANDMESDYSRSKNKVSSSPFSGSVEGFQLDANMMSKKASYGLEEEKMKKNYKMENIKYSVTNAYYGVLKCKDLLNISNNNLENAQRNNNIVKKKFDLGVVSKSELIIAEINLEESKLKLSSSQVELEKSIRALNLLINNKLDDKVNLTTNYKEEDLKTEIQKDIDKAYLNRFDMITLNHNYDLVKIDFETASIKYPENTYIYKIKNRNLQKMNVILSDYKKNIEFDIRNKYDEIDNIKKSIQIAKGNEEKAKEALRLKELSYNAGMGTFIEIKESSNMLYGAKLEVSSLLCKYNLALIDYNKSVNLGQIN